MVARAQIKSIDTARMASDIRDIADQVERGDFVAVAVALADKDGGGGHCCCVNQHFASPDLIDEMVHTLKVAMFESYEDDK